MKSIIVGTDGSENSIAARSSVEKDLLISPPAPELA